LVFETLNARGPAGLGEARFPTRCGAYVALARPTGFNRVDAINIRIPIEGAGDGLMAAGA
jgi:hypothetical protein